MADKVLMVANTSWYLYNFRLPLARHLRQIGFEVVFVSPEDPYTCRLEAEGFRCVPLPLHRKSVNPFRELIALWQFVKIYRREQPVVCHHFTIKCVLYGTIAAKLTGIKAVVNAITGLGHAFLGQGLLHRTARPLLRLLYRRILTARRVQVVFQNGDDYMEFLDRKMVVPDKTTIIRGSGVCTQRFRPRPGPVDGRPEPTILFASRLIREKGIVEFVEAARQLKSKNLAYRFAVAGDIDQGNPSAITQEMLDDWVAEGSIDYLGHIDKIEDVLTMATVVALPSYREGTPRILLEAAAMGKPLVATDVPGCREVVREGYNGHLVPAKDAGALATALQNLLTDPKKLESFGHNSRTLAHEFQESTVIDATVAVYGRAQNRLPDTKS